jgi:hypothetical protein
MAAFGRKGFRAGTGLNVYAQSLPHAIKIARSMVIQYALCKGRLPHAMPFLTGGRTPRLAIMDLDLQPLPLILAEVFSRNIILQITKGRSVQQGTDLLSLLQHSANRCRQDPATRINPRRTASLYSVC